MKIDYRLKSKFEDFQVSEISLVPLLFPKRSAEYTYLWLKKIGLTTFDAQEIIAEYFRVCQSEVNAEGLKDEDAITSQIISIKKLLNKEEINNFNKKFKLTKPTLKIEDIIGYGKESVNKRLLHGNSFKLTVRNLSKITAHKFRDCISNTRLFSLINYYDNQRFGLPGGPYNTHLIGKSIVESDWEKAFFEYKRSEIIIKKNNFLIRKPTSSNDYKNFLKTISPKKMSFFVSSYNSYLWNKKASSLMERLNKGEKYCFDGVGNLFIPQDLSFISANVCKINSHYFQEKNFSTGSRIYIRSLIVNTSVFVVDINNDELNKSKWKVTVSFLLPTGCYATMLIKQIFIGHI